MSAEQEWQTLARQQRTITAIKIYREQMGVGLVTAKAAVEDWVAENVNSSPQALQRRCCCRIGQLLVDYVQSHPPGQVWAFGRPSEITYWQIPESADEPLVPAAPPHLVIFVILPEDTHSEVMRKTLRLLKQDCPHVWQVDPELRIVAVWNARKQGRMLTEDQVLTAEDVLPGFSCRVADLLP